jgi:electron transfer flavoprotein alpha subunit
VGIIRVIEDKCTGCGLCKRVCPFDAIKVENRKARILDTCTLCRTCISACKFDAIVYEEDEEHKTERAEKHEGIWVFAELSGNSVARVTLELICKARQLAAELNTGVSAVLLGYDVEDAVKILQRYGADTVYVVEDPALANFNCIRFSKIIVDLVKEHKPDIFLIGATIYGRSLAPRIAAALDTGLTADCTELGIDKEKGLLLQTRPAFGGDLMATIICPDRRPQMATVRPGVFRAEEPGCAENGGLDAGGSEKRHPETGCLKAGSSETGCFKTECPETGSPETGRQKTWGLKTGCPQNSCPETGSFENVKVVRVQATIPESGVETLEFLEACSTGFDISAADIIVAAGRGIGCRENIALVEELASLIGGMVGSSRAIVDEGWLERCHQVGQSGNNVSPKLYIACGISGAIQHLVGINPSSVIIAINKDPEAPIMKVANYAFVGDVVEILNTLIDRLKKQKAGS